MGSLSTLTLALLQIPGMEAPDKPWTEDLADLWTGGGWMMWPLALAALIGLLVIVWKFFDLSTKGARTRKFLRQADELIAKRRINDALALARDSNTPAGRILAAGLERHDEGTDRVMKAIENVGLIEMASLESGLVWLATVANVAPLMGFLGTVTGMIQAFIAIAQAEGSISPQLLSSGIYQAMVTTATGLIIGLPAYVGYNYLVGKIDSIVHSM